MRSNLSFYMRLFYKTRPFFKDEDISRRQGMTLVEVLIVASLISVISLAVYNSLASGLKIWERNRHLIVEEDILIFFEKFSQDVRNSFIFSKILYEGTEIRFACPVLVDVFPDPKSGLPLDEYVTQVGKVEYYFDYNEHKIYKRKANYSQALKGTYGLPQSLVSSVDDLRFRYIYIAKDGEQSLAEIANVIPSSIEVEVKFSDRFGSRVMKRIIDLPVGI